MRNALDGGEALLEALRRLGVDYLFASPGSEWGPLWEALARQAVERRDGPRWLESWHEGLSVDMAIGCAEMTGRTQAVVLHTGVGLLQGAMAIQAALLSETPLVILSGEALSFGEDPAFDPGAQWYRSLGFAGGPQRLVAPIVKWAGQAASVHTLFEGVVRAGELAARPPAGPVYLSVAIEAMVAEWSPPARTRQVPPRSRTRPRPEDVAAVAALLAGAREPLVVAEDAGRDPAAFAALVDLADLLALPVVEAPTASCANFPKDHPLHQGTDLAPFHAEADVVLLAGSRSPWYPPGNAPPGATIVAAAETPLKAHLAYQNAGADRYLEGELAASLAMLAEAVRATGVAEAEVAARRARLRQRHETLWAADRAAEAAAADARPIDPVHLVATLGAVMPSDTLFVDETVLHGATLQRHLPWSGPQSYVRKWGGLGQGLGVALGCKLALPQRPVALLVGDGSFLYNPIVQGLGAARQHGLPILVVIFDNAAYGAMRRDHLSHYPDGIAAQTGIFHGVAIDGPDYAELGRPFGFTGRRVEDPAELAEAIRAGLAEVAAGRTFILDVLLRE